MKLNRSFATLIFFVIVGFGAVLENVSHSAGAMLYEGLKKNATIVIVPSTAVESMQLGGLAGMTSLTMELGQGGGNGHKDGGPRQQETTDDRPRAVISNATPSGAPAS